MRLYCRDWLYTLIDPVLFSSQAFIQPQADVPKMEEPAELPEGLRTVSLEEAQHCSHVVSKFMHSHPDLFSEEFQQLFQRIVSDKVAELMTDTNE